MVDIEQGVVSVNDVDFTYLTAGQVLRHFIYCTSGTGTANKRFFCRAT